jgi:hypothetical protein
MKKQMTRTLMILALVAGCDGVTTPNEPPATAAYTAYVRGPLAGDLTVSQGRHDDLVRGGQDEALAAGDLSHRALLDTGETGRPLDEFLAIDQWVSVDGPATIYADPDFQAGFARLFAQPVQPELYARHPAWYGWGSIAPPADGAPYWVMVVKGHLAKATEAENHAAHDAVASGFEQIARGAGDYAHVPHLGIDDPRAFFNIDISTSHEGLLAVLQNPDFGRVFGALFDAPPEVHIYRSTEWLQW